MKAKVLILEDNTELALTAKQLLADFEVDLTDNAHDALELSYEHDYDLYIVDIKLAESDGLEVCKVIRDYDTTTPILIITGNSQMRYKLKAFQTGVDDYLTKPFNMLEFRARVTALLKRAKSASAGEVLQISDLTLNTGTREATRNGKTLALRRKEFDILVFLAKNRGMVVSTDTLLENFWDGNSDLKSNTLAVHIKNIRQQVDSPFEKKLLKTHYGVGYKLD